MADAWGEITAAENVLRDLIEELLTEHLGSDWFEKSGLTEERRTRIEDALAEERRRRDGGEVSNRLIYYSNLVDLQRILEKHWSLFSECFGDLKTMRVYLARLVDFRNPEMHGRDLLPFENHLVYGITGEIRNKVTIYRSRRGGEKEFFPRIEYAADSFGNVAQRVLGGLEANTGLTLHPGDRVEFTLRAWDPEGKSWEWNVMTGHLHAPTRYRIDGDRIEWEVTEDDISEAQRLIIGLRGARSYHRHAMDDDSVDFWYRVLPK